MPGVARKPAQPRLDRGSTLAQLAYGGWPIAHKSLPVRDRVRSNDLLAVGTVAPADGPDGPAISFPGTTGNYLQTAAKVFDPGAGDFTAAIWFYLNVGGVQSLLIPVSGVGTGTSWLDLTSTTLIRTSVGASVTTGTTASTLTWHLAAVTVQGTTVTLYLDGLQVAQSTRTVAGYSGAKLRVGAGSTGTNALNGLVGKAGVMLWQRALAAAEVMRYYAAPYRIWTPPESTWAAFNYVAPVGGGGLILPRGFDGGYAG